MRPAAPLSQADLAVQRFDRGIHDGIHDGLSGNVIPTTHNTSPGAVPTGATAAALPHHVIALRLTGHLDLDALRAAVDAVARRHPALRGRVTGHEPGLLVLDRPGADPVHTASSLAALPFDRTAEAPARLHVVRLGEADHLMVLVFHRIAMDVPSAMRVVADLGGGWTGVPCGTRPVSLPRDESPARAAPRPRPPDLPLDRARPASATANAVGAPFLPAPDLLARVARECGSDEHTALLALLAVVLHRYDGGTEIGMVVPMPGTTTEVGCFERLVPIVVEIGPDAMFSDVVASVRHAVDGMVSQDNTIAPPDRALPVVRWDRDPEFSGFGVHATNVPLPTRFSAVDLALELRAQPGRGVRGEVVVATDVFTRDTAARIAAHLDQVLAEVAAGPNRPIGTLPLLTSAERAAFDAVNGEDLPDAPEPFHRVFARRAAVRPAAVAVRAEDGVLTYAALDRSANQLAHLLRDLGVGPEVAVGLCLDRGTRLAVAVLGVLKAGGAYVPLALDDPVERRAGIVADSGVTVVLADRPLHLPGCHVVDLTAADALGERPDDAPPACADVAAEPTSAAYILYTSGSTGKPKGVVVEHRQLTAYVNGVIARLGMDLPMRFAMVQPLTVDSSATAFFPPLCTGGEVHVLSRATALDPDRLADWVAEHGVDCLKIAPSHLRSLQASPRFTELLPARLLVVGGEASDWRWLRALQESVPHCQVHNHYGPTETTVGVLTLAVADHLDAEWDVAPIGRPLPGVRVAVVDRNGREVPVGVVGELVVQGATVARGYHEHPELTAAAFGPDGGRYATGDLARRLADGTVVFVGRRDDQVKVRGFRVELGEVDAALRAHPGVRGAVTVVREDAPGDRAVVSYVEPRGLPADELRRHMAKLLPPHMVPRAIVVLDRLPLSPHGKVDRSALPSPTPTETGRTPETDLERVVARAWQQVLGRRTVGADVNFFDVGGHSLLLVELQQRLRAALDREVELMDLLAHATVRDQARLLAGARKPTRAEPGRPQSRRQAALLRHGMRQRRTKDDRRD